MSQLDERRRTAILVGAVLLLIPLYAATASWDTAQSNDTRSAALAGWTFATTGSLAFDDLWDPRLISWPVEGRDGQLYSNRFPGVIAVAAVAYAIPAATGLVPSGPLVHPYQVPVWPATLAAVLIAAVAAGLTYRLFREMDVSQRVAAVAAAFVALGTPLWSVSADALWTHGATHVLLVCVLLSLLRGRTVGAACFAMAAITFRPHLVVPVLVLAVGQRDWPPRLWLASGGVGGLLLVAAYSFWIFGQPLPAAGYPMDHLVSGAPAASPAYVARNLWDWLFDPLRGVLFFVPVAALGLPRLRAAWREAPEWIRLAAIAGGAYASIQLGLLRASGGTFFFGHRTTIEALVLAAPLLLLSVHRLASEGTLGRIATAVVVGYSIAIHAFGAWVDMPHDRDAMMREEHERIRSAVESAARLPTRGDPLAVHRPPDALGLTEVFGPKDLNVAGYRPLEVSHPAITLQNPR